MGEQRNAGNEKKRLGQLAALRVAPANGTLAQKFALEARFKFDISHWESVIGLVDETDKAGRAAQVALLPALIVDFSLELVDYIQVPYEREIELYIGSVDPSVAGREHIENALLSAAGIRRLHPLEEVVGNVVLDQLEIVEHPQTAQLGKIPFVGEEQVRGFVFAIPCQQFFAQMPDG